MSVAERPSTQRHSVLRVGAGNLVDAGGCVLQLELVIDGSRSLKDKRRAIKSLKERLQGTFNTAVAEIDQQDDRRQATFGIAVVGNDHRFLDSCLNKIVNYIRRDREVELVDYEIDFR